MKRIYLTIFFSLLLIATFVLLTCRCFYLQYYLNDHYNKLCLQQQHTLQNWQPQRGVILDTTGRVLAASNRTESVFAEPRIIEDVTETAIELSSVLGIGAYEIYQTILDSKNPGFVVIKKDADKSEQEAARKIYGIGIESDFKRVYPMGSLMGNIVGFTSTDNRGLGGIEFKYDQLLTGTSSQNIFYADSRRRPIRLKEQNGSLQNGMGVVLTIDATIQQFVREELIKQYETFEAESAVAVVANPKTGEILAMVSIPDFDPNNIQSADPDSFRNRLVTDPFEPGSMIKPIIAAIALDCGAISKNQIIFCENGNYRGKGFGTIHEYRTQKYGNLSIRKIIIKSSNIGMAKIGQIMGKEKLYKGLKMFGFGEKTGIEMNGEVGGLLRPTEKWTSYSVTRIPYGYEINVTGMQMLKAYCILANGGRVVQPYLVRAVVDSNGQIVQIRRSNPSVGYVIKRDVADWMIQDCLVGVVNERSDGGTGWRAKLDKWQVFGKTGTADIANIETGEYEENNNTASFVAGAPAENPRIVVLVSIRRPNSSLNLGDSGGAVASPVAGKIIEKTLTYLENKYGEKF